MAHELQVSKPPVGYGRSAASSHRLQRAEVDIAQMMALGPTLSSFAIKNTRQSSDLRTHEHLWLYPMIKRSASPSPSGPFLRKPPLVDPLLAYKRRPARGLRLTDS
jgi:hypothetical protein